MKTSTIGVPIDSELASRVFEDEPHAGDSRTPFQHDKDRILYSTAFRRLQYKTQVFVIHEGDLYRTRLTHSLEVAQISRSIASSLRANADLAESIALAHDLGHAPFGHAGSDKLDDLARAHGLSFEHNFQSYRVVSCLEKRYPGFDGLNLTMATLEGILRHRTYFDYPAEMNVNVLKSLPDYFVQCLQSANPSAEAQIVNLADVIAYASHDIEDALSIGLIDWTNFTEIVKKERVTFLDNIIEKEIPECISEDSGHLLNTNDSKLFQLKIRIMARLIVDKLITEAIKQSKSNIEKIDNNKQAVWQNIRESRHITIALPDKLGEEVQTLVQDILFKHVYEEPRVILMMEKGKKILELLFDTFVNQPKALPKITQARLSEYFEMTEDEQKSQKGESILVPVVIDFISGMTDKYAMDTYDFLTQAYLKAL